MNFFSLPSSLHEFFFLAFSLAWIFFWFFPHLPHHFSNGPSLSYLGKNRSHLKNQVPSGKLSTSRVYLGKKSVVWPRPQLLSTNISKVELKLLKRNASMVTLHFEQKKPVTHNLGKGRLQNSRFFSSKSVKKSVKRGVRVLRARSGHHRPVRRVRREEKNHCPFSIQLDTRRCILGCHKT